MKKTSTIKQAVILFIIILFVFCPIVLIAKVQAQQLTSPDDQIPSDLSLDLHLAQQNPAPDQQQIVQSETKQAEIVTTTGDTTTVQPQDTVAPEVKTESKQEALNPDQTTSEQIITKPEEVNVDDNGTPVPTESNQNQGSPTGDQPTGIQSQNGVTGEPGSTDNFVPGTNVAQPDDNAAPSDNSTNPDLPAPTQSSDNNQTTPTQTDQQSNDNQPSTSPTPDTTGGNSTQPTNATQPSDNSQQNIPQESQPQTSPATNDTNPSDSGSQDQSQPSSDTNTNGNSSSVQGASTGPNPFIAFLQYIKQKFIHIFLNIK